MSEPNKEIINNLIGFYNSKNFSKLIKTISVLEEKYPNSIYLLNILGGVHSELKILKMRSLVIKELLN